MRFNLAILTVVFLVGRASAQTITEIDSISFELCTQLEKTKEMSNDLDRFDDFRRNQFNEFLETVQEHDTERVKQVLFYRLQRNCLEFIELLDRIDPAKVDTINRVDSKPNSNISKQQIETFKKTSDFYYFEINGDTTFVNMSNGFWTDQFKNGTSSTLTYVWVGEEDFELTFQESNNEARKYFSIIGDKFSYSLISKETNHYILTLKLPSHTKYEKMKLYIK